MLKAIIFDVDDTLLDWEPRAQDWRDYEREHLRGVFDYVRREVYPLEDFDAFFADVQRRAELAWTQAALDLRAPHMGRVLVAALEAAGVPPERLDMEACLRAYDWRGMPGVALYPDVTDCLVTLRGHGLRLGMVTNAYSPMWMRDEELQSLGLPVEWFDCRLSSADVGYLKPHPVIFQRALDCLEVRPEETVFIGDNLEADIGGAQGMGMRAVLRVRHGAEAANGSLIAPDATIHSLHGLPALLDAWYPGWQNGA